jgi:S-DNA-T family DNA segregation ATPase FtsK/SpoIIIE
MKKPAPSKTVEGFTKHLWEIRGLLVLAGVAMLFLSLLSFAYGHQTHNWLGLVGFSIGWSMHATFGIGSYVIALYLAWIGICYIFHRPEWVTKLNHLYFGIFVISLCILLSLLEDQYPAAGKWLSSIFYSRLAKQKMYYHLGGAPMYYVYHDLPAFNLQRIFNTAGVAIIFASTLLASVIFLFRISLANLFNYLWQKLTALKMPSKPILKPVSEPVIVDNPQPEEDFMRYVKLRIPDLQPSWQDASVSSDMLAIKPEKQLTARPSISSKEEKPTKEIVVKPAAKEMEKPAPEPEKPKPKPKAEIPPIVPATPPSAAISSPPAAEAPNKKREHALKAQRVYNGDYTDYKVPPLTLLSNPKKVDQSALKKDLRKQAEVLEETLMSFGIEAKVGQINCGPTITSFEVHPSIGVKVQKIRTLENDIALNMEAKSIRIIAPIPGKAAVGIEVPNASPQEVSFKEMLIAYQQSPQKFKIPVLLGKTVAGEYVMSDLTKMPHCIIAGATGSGKSVCINTIVMSILYSARPDEIQLVMIDPKKVELTPYSQLPHMIAPVITEPQGAYTALKWLVGEMEFRYELLKQIGVRNIEAFNNRTRNVEHEKALEIEVPEKLPYIVGIVDELADLMMVANNDIETPIARIAQMARAVGIHLILATQRPSREVITGLIKANFPTRISFKVASRVNSQIVLDEVGAEALLGNGDMLFQPPGTSYQMRAQGAFIRDDDIHAVIKFISDQAPANYRIPSFDTYTAIDDNSTAEKLGGSGDTLYEQALDIVTSTGNASTTFLQRKLKIGYARAAGLMDELESKGVVTPPDGSKARRVIHGRGGNNVNAEDDEE